MAKQPSGRGSVKLSAAASAIKKRLKGVKVIDWHEVGTPHPEVVIGTVQTGVANFKANLGTLRRRPRPSQARGAAGHRPNQVHAARLSTDRARTSRTVPDIAGPSGPTMQPAMLALLFRFGTGGD